MNLSCKELRIFLSKQLKSKHVMFYHYMVLMQLIYYILEYRISRAAVKYLNTVSSMNSNYNLNTLSETSFSTMIYCNNIFLTDFTKKYCS